MGIAAWQNHYGKSLAVKGEDTVIRRFRQSDLKFVMGIWLDTNKKAHHFISPGYWMENYESVKEALPKAEVFVYEEEKSRQIKGFIGLIDNDIAGIFVEECFQSKGIGKQLLDYVKQIKPYLTLHVYQKNERAINFYRREHFMVRSETIDKSTNEKEWMMTWEKRKE